MEVCTEGTVAVPDGRADLVLVLLRRVGVVVGVLFGLGVVAVIAAGHAAADERNDTSENRGLGRLTGSVTAPLSDAVEPVSEGVVKPLTSAVSPVVSGVAESVAPVVRPVAEAVAPVTKPVLEPVVAAAEPVLEPVLDSVAPVTEPVLSPVLDAAEPVLDPVTEATGTDEVTRTVTGDAGRQSGAPPAERSPLVPAETPAAAPVVAPVPAFAGDAVSGWSGVDGVPASAGPSAGAAQPVSAWQGMPSAPVPGSPGVPAQIAVTGGGSVSTTGGGHGPAAVTSGPDTTHAQQASHGRSPPGTIVGAAWFAYDDRDHPR